MKQGMRVVGVEALVRKFREHPELIARTQESVLRQEARGLCVEYGSATMPGPGFGEENAEKFRQRVEREVKQVFVTKANTQALYRMILRRSKRLAAGFLRATKAERPDQVRRILQEAGIAVEGLNPAVHKAARTGKKGSVPKSYSSTTVVSEPQARAYAKRQAALVGVAKAGWYAAAKGLGGRVRRNLVDDAGKRRTEEIFPGYVRKLARKFPDLGGARVTSTGSRTRVEIFTRVKHGEAAMPAGLRAAAESRARERLGAAMAKAVREVNGRKFRRVA